MSGVEPRHHTLGYVKLCPLAVLILLSGTSRRFENIQNTLSNNLDTFLHVHKLCCLALFLQIMFERLFESGML